MHTRSRSQSGWLRLVAVGLVCSGLAVDAIELGPKAKKRLDLLLAAPQSGYLLDRFCGAWLEQGTDEELRAFVRAEADTPDGTSYAVVLANLLERDGDLQAAAALYDDAVARAAAKAPALYYRACFWSDCLAADKAAADLEAALQAEPSESLRVEILKRLGRAYTHAGQRAKATAAWGQLLQATKETSIQDEVLELQIEEGQLDIALVTCESLRKQAQDAERSAMLAIRAGDICRRVDRKEEGRAHYRRALELAPAGTPAAAIAISKLTTLLRTGDDETPLHKALAPLVEILPDCTALLARYVEALEDAGDTAKAEEAAARLVAAVPESRESRRLLLRLLAVNGDVAAIPPHTTRLLETAPDTVQELLGLAGILADAGQDQAALSLLQQHVTEETVSENAGLRLARFLSRFERTEALDQLFSALRKQHADSVSIREAHARCLYAAKATQQAKQELTALGGTCDLPCLLRIVDLLVRNDAHTEAQALLAARADEFRAAPAFLDRRFAVAAALGEIDGAIAIAPVWVGACRSPKQISSALSAVGALLRQHDRESAVRGELLQATARQPGATCLLAQLCFDNGDGELAAKLLRDALAAQPSDPVLNLRLLWLARLEGKWDEAATVLTRIVETNPELRADARKELAAVLARAGRIDDARAAIARWRQAAPEDPKPYIEEANVLIGVSREDDAIDVLREGIRALPGDLQLKQRLMEVCQADGRIHEARSLAWEVLEQSSALEEKLGLLQMLTTGARMFNDMAGLAERFRQMHREGGNRVFALLALARIHQTLGQPEKQAAYVAEAAELQSDDLAVLHELIRFFQQQNNAEQALRLIKAACRVDQTAGSRCLLASHHLAKGDEEKGNALIDQIRHGSADNPNAVRDLAALLIAGKQPGRALELLRASRGSARTNYQLDYLTAVALEEEGQFEQSVAMFLAVLDCNEELPDSSRGKTSSSAWLNTYLDRMTRFLPEDAVALFEAQSMQHRVYAFRQTRNIVSLYPFGQRHIVGMPSRLERIPSYVLTHLTSLAQQVDEGTRSQIVRELTMRGVRNAEIRLSLSPQLYANPGTLTALAEQNPDNEALRAVKIMMGLHMPVNTAKELTDSMAVFKERYPVLSILAAFCVPTDTPLEATVIDGAVTRLSEMAAPDNVLMMMIAQALYARQRRGNALPDAVVKRLADSLLALAEKADDSPQPFGGVSLPELAVRLLSQSGDYARLISVLDAQMRAPNAGRATPGHHVTGGHRSKMTAELLFPPSSLPGLPAAVGPLFGAGRDYRFGGQAKPDREELKPHIGKATDPLLKAYLAGFCELDADMDELVGQFVKEDPPVLNRMLMAASWLGHQGKAQQALNVLDGLDSQPMSRQTRRQVDCAILAYAEKLDDTEPARATVRKAVRRLKAQRLRQHETQQLAQVATRLGLDEEAASLGEAAAAAATATAPQAVQYGGNIAINSGTVREQLRKGETEKGVKLAARAFSDLARYWANLGTTYQHYNAHEIQQLVKALRDAHAEEDVITALRPEPKKETATRLFELGFVLECLDRGGEAAEVYRKVLQLQAKHRGANLRLALAHADTAPDTAKAHIKAVSHVNTDMVAQQISNSLHAFHSQFDKRHGHMCMLACLLEEADPKQGSFQWLSNVFSTLQNSTYVDGRAVPGVLQPDTTGENRPARYDEMRQKREALFLRLCDTALQIPQVREMAFGQKHAFMKFREQDLAPLYETAKGILASSAPTAGTPGYHVVHWGGGQQNQRVTPEQFMLTFAHRNGRMADLQAFAEKLSTGDARNRNAGKRLLAVKALYDAPDDQAFLGLAKKLKFPPSGTASSQPSRKAVMIVNAWEATERAVDLGPLLLAQLKQDIANSPHGNAAQQAASYLVAWARALCRADDSARAAAFLGQLKDALFSKREQQMLAKASPESITHQTDSVLYQKLHNIQNVGRTLASEKELFFPTLRVFEPILTKLQHGYNQMTYWSHQLSRSHDLDADWLVNSCLAADWGTFRSFSARESNESVLIRIADLFRKKERREEALAKLAQAEGTFGSGLLSILIGTSNSRETMQETMAHCADFAARIQQGPAESQHDLAAFIRCYCRRHSIQLGTLQLTGKARTFYELYTKLTGTELKDRIAEFLKITDVGHNYYNFCRKGMGLCQELAALDTAAAEEVFNHMWKIVDRLCKSGTIGSSSTPQQIIINQNLHNLSRDPKALLFAFNMVCRHGSLRSLEQLRHRFNSVYHSLQRDVQNSMKKSTDGKQPSRTDILIATMEREAEMFDHVPYAPLAASYYQRLRSSSLDWDQLGTWLDSEAVQQSPLLMQAVFMAELSFQRRNRKPMQCSDDMIRFYTELLQNTDMPAAARLNVFFGLRQGLRDAGRVDELSLPATVTFLEMKDGEAWVPHLILPLAHSLTYSPQDAAWQDVAKGFADAWKGRASRTSQSAPDTTSQLLALAVARLRFQLGEQQGAMAIIESTEHALSNFPDAYLVALEGGQSDWCVEQLAQRATTMAIHPRAFHGIRMTAPLRAAANSVIDRTQSREHKLFSALLYAAFSLSPVDEDGLVKHREKSAQTDDLEMLAEEFLETDFTDNKLRLQCFRVLRTTPLKDKVNAVIPELYADRQVVSLLGQSSELAEQETAVYQAYCGILLDRGDFAAIHDMTDQLLAYKGRREEWPFRRLCSRLCQTVGARLRKKAPIDEQSVGPWLELMKHMLKLGDQFSQEWTAREVLRQPYFLSGIVMLGALDPDQEAFDKFLASNDAKWVKKLARHIDEKRHAELFCALMGFPESPTDDEGVDLLECYLDFCADPVFSQCSPSIDEVCRALLRREPFKGNAPKWRLEAARYFEERKNLALALRLAKEGAGMAKTPDLKEWAAEMVARLGEAVKAEGKK